jgi:GNAT superfamily N-acetyltransferase
MSAPLERLDWDSAFFGVPIARVTARRVDEAALADALSACRAQRIRCAYLLLDADDARGSELAQAAGFVLRDVRVTLERPLEGGEGASARGDGPIAPARAGQRAALEAVARDAFAHTRFLDDDGFPDERCRELYAAFVRRGLDGAPERLTLADPGARGFIVCRFDRDAGVGEIELIAVAADGRGQGLGGALVAAALAAFADAGLRRARVATQAANVASQRIYQRAGFRTHEVALWLHRWFD